MNITKQSKFLSLILRHVPEKASIELGPAGWASVDKLLENVKWSMATLEDVVENNNKKRFEFNEDSTKIRARQGHSVKVDLGYEETKPPEILYHGTASKFIDLIMTEGLKPMSRHHVHLSLDRKTAIDVGGRHGRPVVIEVMAENMYNDGYKFYLSNNGVWLTNNVPIFYMTTFNGFIR